MFNYLGYDEEELLRLCDEVHTNKGKAPWIYWTSEVYSFGLHLRNYGFYPSFLPLYIYSDHGIGNPTITQHETQNDAEWMFVTFDEKAKNYRQESQKPCSTIIAPFIWYRRHNKVNQTQETKGTLAFPAHSTPEVEAEFDIKEYINQLKNLPKDMQPVCVCLHMHDINKGQYKIFIENDIPVYTVGNAFDVRFAERYYDILKNFKYTTSNLIGSYTYYSVEMGIPFSLYGAKNRYFNISDKNLPEGEYNYENKEYIASAELFKGINKTISTEQKQYVENILGINSTISRFEFAKILYLSYFKRGNIFKDLTNKIFRKTKMRIKNEL